MNGKTLIKSVGFMFISAITACSTGGGGDAFSTPAKSAPVVQNQPANTTANNSDTNSNNAAAPVGEETSTGNGTQANSASAASAGESNTETAATENKDKAEDIATAGSTAAPAAAGAAPSAAGAPVAGSAAIPVAGAPVAGSAVALAGTAADAPAVAAVTALPVVLAELPVSATPPKATPAIILHSAAGSGLHSGEGRLFQPAKLMGAEGKVIYALGTDELRINATDLSADNKRLNDFSYDDKVLINNRDIDPTKVQTLEVSDNSGKVVGTFQFVKQTNTTYMTFMPNIPRAQSDGSVEYFTGTYSYIATPTTDADFSKLTGKFTYSGKVVGYSYPLNVGDKISSTYPSFDALPSRPTRATPADITLEADFDTKTIKGKVTNRFDHLAGRSFRWTDDDDNVTQKGLNFDKQPLILEGVIKKDGDVWGFQGPGSNGIDGVYIETTPGTATTKQRVADWGGIFAGEGASEVVGVISSKETMTFGATKNSP